MFTTRPLLRGSFGAVASTHWLASSVGMAVLEKGGNAFDAAVAIGFTLQVVEPHLNGPGGEVPIIFHAASEGPEAVRVLCGQGVAPAGATIAHYRGLGLDLVPGTGLLATVVPGAFDAWMLLLRDYGRLPPREVLAYAIGYAGEGYPLVPLAVATVERVAELFRNEWPSSAELYLKNGAPPLPGIRFANPALAATYRRLVEEGEAAGGGRERQIEAMRAAWAKGFVAEEIGRFAQGREVMDSSGRRHRGVIQAEDLARWEASYEAPVGLDFREFRVLKAGPWGQGPVFLQQLALLSGLGLESMAPDGPDFLHSVVECAKLAFADREAYYGDPNFVEVPLEALLSPAYNDARRREIATEASLALRPGRLPHFEARLRGFEAAGEECDFDALGSGEPTVASDGTSRGDTCHLDVADRWGNLVSATPSGGWLQSSPVIPALGFCLNSRAQMFWLEEGLPASLAPGKRPRSTLSVTLALKEGRPYMTLGTPGGDYQDQWSLAVFLRHALHGMNLQEAIDAPAFQTDHMPSSFWPRKAKLGSLSLEARFPRATIEELRRRGHRLEVVDPWSLGRVSAVAKGAEGFLEAAANPRFMQGYAVAR